MEPLGTGTLVFLVIYPWISLLLYPYTRILVYTSTITMGIALSILGYIVGIGVQPWTVFPMYAYRTTSMVSSGTTVPRVQAPVQGEYYSRMDGSGEFTRISIQSVSWVEGVLRQLVPYGPPTPR